MNLFDYVAQQIRALRQSYNSGEGLSQEVLAAKIGVASNTISRWETGTYHPDLGDLEKLARFFGQSILCFLPPEEISVDDNTVALLRTAKGLLPEDLEEVQKYAEFRRARALYKNRSRPQAGRKAAKILG
ncbi:MAG: helix-turn-helix transcriptional regulator [Pyrinomonadaceae bacterium]